MKECETDISEIKIICRMKEYYISENNMSYERVRDWEKTVSFALCLMKAVEPQNYGTDPTTKVPFVRLALYHQLITLTSPSPKH